MTYELTTQQEDTLKEIEHIGAGKATSDISKMVNKEVTLSQPEIHLLSLKKAEEEISGPQQLVVGIYTSFDGTLKGNGLLVLPLKEALKFTDILSNKKLGTNKHLAKSDVTKLNKVGSILEKKYLASIFKFLKISVNIQKSSVVSTFGENLSDVVLQQKDVKDILLIHSIFSVKDVNIKGEFFLLLAPESMEMLMKKLKV